ncbi:class I SAM-dependent DNA methyltransferase [Devosia aurantiaca]|uniref:class I SAM-dependent DNA methyltransferase n=1 Tax=Devosia aurantiaca TaxID=2714858 RepID=UPI001A989C67|nr:DNA methyltransferase [Devosia aurantiaca]
MTLLDKLIAEAAASGGSERANYQLFISGLCDVLGVPGPAMSQEINARNDYVFERSLDYRHPDGSTTKLYVDCYKRGSFVLEAKQSARRQADDERQTSLFGSEANSRRMGHARRGSRGWDRVMRAAYTQAVDYTRHLPIEHGYPPFVILVDVGHVIELYADFSGQGKNYAQFPDAKNFRIFMEDLRDPVIQARLKAVWTDPQSLDPAKKSAEVTRDIAGRLSIIAKRLEGKHDPKDVAEFLMRCLFTMFAEDVGLLPKKLMVELLEKLVDNPTAFPPAMESLWRTMNSGGFEPHSMASLKHFNGGLFARPKALPLAPEDIHELLVAARMDWRDVEPAIFGTLLERALDPRERSKLGAHYTPRAYVERLVVPTIIEPLRANWDKVQATIEEALKNADLATALARAKAFHHELCTIRVLDPACGTGNFLYVSLELLKKLEGEVLAAIESLGEDQSRLMMEGETVSPRQFYGLELNPRAVPIADLVLWIGYLKWQLRTAGPNAISEPVLHAYGTIRQQDAILAYDSKELVRDEDGVPVTRWDGVTYMIHPVSFQKVPDPEARIEIYRYRNPRPAQWPEAEFIVANPPFIGNKRMRDRLGTGYVDAVREAYGDLPGSIDFVLYWWARAAAAVGAGKARALGFVTTNSVNQSLNRPVLARYIGAQRGGIHLTYCVPNHPWVDDTEGAAVRVAMTVAAPGDGVGTLEKVLQERANSDGYFDVLTHASVGHISAGLRIGAAVTSSGTLIQNDLIAHQGVITVGSGFRLNAVAVANYHDEVREGLVRPYKIGSDLLYGWDEKYVIDANKFSEAELASNYPKIYQHLSDNVRPSRIENADPVFKEQWWRWGRRRPELMDQISTIKRYIATCRTATHRLFNFELNSIVPDAKIIAIASSDGAFLSSLSSRVHLLWSEDWARLGVGDDSNYNHSECFTTFPWLLRNVDLVDLGERLDAFRKERLAAHDFLTMTGLYNVLERVRELDWKAGAGRHSDSAAQIERLSDKERDIYEAGHIAILKDIHDKIDTLVLAAYGWSDLAPRLVGRPGATTPSPYKTDDQLAAEEELLTRLVTLNQERAAEEARGLVRWLRPDYQIPKLGHKVARLDGIQQEADIAILPVSDKPRWPTSDTEQINILVDLLRKAPSPVPSEILAATFDGRNTTKRRDRVASLLVTLTTIGLARSGRMEGQDRYFIPR